MACRWFRQGDGLAPAGGHRWPTAWRTTRQAIEDILMALHQPGPFVLKSWLSGPEFGVWPSPMAARCAAPPGPGTKESVKEITGSEPPAAWAPYAPCPLLRCRWPERVVSWCSIHL